MLFLCVCLGWFGSRVVSVLDSGAEARVQIAVATLSVNSFRQTVRTHRASVHQAARFVAALLRVAGVTAGLAESCCMPTARFMTHVTCRMTAKNRDQLRNPTLGSRVWATFLCPSVSVTRRCSTRTAQRRNTLTVPHNRPSECSSFLIPKIP